MDGNKPPVRVSDIASDVWNLVCYWAMRAWSARSFRYSGIGTACVLALFLAWPRGPSRADLEQARLRATQEAIKRVIHDDHVLSEHAAQRVGLLDQYWDGSTIVSELAGQMDLVDLEGCPQDFQLAYKKHVAAWASLGRVKASHEGFNGFIKGFLTSGLSAIPAFSEIERAASDVQSTWSEVQQVAIRHGVAP